MCVIVDCDEFSCRVEFRSLSSGRSDRRITNQDLVNFQLPLRGGRIKLDFREFTACEEFLRTAQVDLTDFIREEE